MTLHDLRNETVAAETLRQNLADLLGDDETLIRDTIEGETKLFDLIEDAIKQIQFDQAIITGIDGFLSDLQTRKGRIKDRVDGMRTALCVALETAELKTRETPAGTVTVKATPAKVIINDESEIPAQWWKPQDPKLDRAALLTALKDKQEIPGCTLSNGGTTAQVRIK